MLLVSESSMMHVFLFPCAGSDEDDDGAAVLEFENALNFWREYIIARVGTFGKAS